MRAVEAREFDVVLMDLNYARDTTSGQEGLDLLTRMQAIDPTLPVVVMTAWASVDLAVEAMRRGARDFVQKPWENARLLTILRTQVELARALRRGQRLEAENRALRGGGARPRSSRSRRHAPGAGDDRARRPLATPTCCSPARTARARARSPARCTRPPRARRGRSPA